MPTVTFSEQPVGTTNPVFTFSNNTLKAIGRIVTDSAQPGSPVIAANSSYMGPVFLYFSRPVTSVSLLAGYFDNLSSTRIEFRDAQGHVLASFHNQQYGVVNFSFSSQAGIASVVVIDERADVAGFSVDTVVFGPPISVDPPLVAKASNPFAGLDRYYGEVGSTSLIFHETLGAGDTVDTIAFYAKAAGTVTFHIALDSDPSNMRDVTLAVVAGDNRFSFQPPTLYSNALGYTARIELDLALPSKEEAMDRWISETGEKILGGTLSFQEFKFELLALMQQLDNADDAARLLGKVGKAYGLVGIAFDLGSRIHAVATSGNNWREEGFVQLTDLALQTMFTVVPATAGTFVGTPLLGLIGGFTGSLVYTFGLSDDVQETARIWYRTPDSPNMLSAQAFAVEAAAPLIDLETIRFDPVYYLAQHADARAAVASGTFASAYLHYLAVGAALGYRPSANVAPIPLGEIAVLTTPELARQGYNSALFTTAAGGFAGDGLSAAEAQFNAALDDARTDGDSLDVDRTLTAVANRVARDAVLNRLDPPGQAFEGADLAGWIATLSNGKGLSQNFSSLALFTGVQMFAIHSAATSAEEVLAAFLRDPASAAALFGPATKSVGIGEFGGVWVLIFAANTSSVPPAAEAGPLDVILVGDTGSDALYAGGGRGTLSGGDGSDELVGGNFDDRIDGGAGDDLISGGGGIDQMAGGPGNDLYFIAQIGDIVTEAADAGTDEVRTSLADTTAPANVENITGLLDTGQILRGNALANLIAGGAGSDQMIGGLGNDVYLVGAGDTVIEAAGAGSDEARTALAAYTLTANVENLTGTLASGQTLTGNALANVIAGAAGADTMTGGAGNDSYVVNHSGDVVNELAGGGTDEVRTSLASASLADYANVENLTGISPTGQTLTGNSGNNIVSGGAGADTLRLYQGGNDTANGGAGNDNIFFIGSLTSADVVNGGDGVDTLVLQGPYGALTLTANITQIENISILAGSNTNFGEPGTNRYDYVITTNNANFAAGVQARINGAALLAGEDFTFDGRAEMDASFVVYGGKGKDTLLGGFGNDIFFYAEERFATGDTVNGGPGYDGMFLRGNYTIDFNAPGYTGLFTNIENLTLTSATDERYARGGGTEFDYNLILSNAIVKPGETLTVSGALLMATETMVLDASQEADGLLRLFGGKANDILKGGSQADLIHGNLGADTLAGGGGADTFRYDSTTESNAASRDRILDFTPGTDRIDLGRIDANSLAAGDQAFVWIGSNPFSKAAGQLRAFQSGADWIVEGDVDGDGFADLTIALTLQGAQPLGPGDFLP